MDHAAVRRIRRRPRSPTGGYQELIEAGATGLSVAFDLPTQMGYDSDAPIAHGEVGKVGVAIDSLEDMRVLFDGIPLGEVSTSMTINAPAAVLLAALPAGRLRSRAAARTRSPARSRTTCSRSTSRAAPTSTRPARRCGWSRTSSPTATRSCPRWNTISISGYHMAEAGATPVQEIAFTLANGIGVRAGRAGRGPGTSTSSRRGCRSSSWPARRCWRRWRSSAPRAGCGPGSCGRSSAPPNPRVADAPLPHPDRGRPAHRAAARGQRRPRRRPGPRGGARRHAVAAHELLRRGHRAARARRPRGSRCAPSRCWPTRPT